MIDKNDNAPVDLFPVKRRGRPSTGKTKTPAEYQAAYRRRKAEQGMCGAYALNHWIDGQAKFALDRLAKHNGITISAMLEQLIINADNQILSKLELYSDEWNVYYD